MEKIKLTELKKWKDEDFEVDDFDKFDKLFNDVKNSLENNLENLRGLKVMNLYKGPFYISGFIQNMETDRCVYFTTSDVRYWKSWWSNILIRKARNSEDYKGEENHYCPLEDIISRAIMLLEYS